MAKFKIINSDWIDALKSLDDQSVQCCVTSPPYWGLRRYMDDRVQLKNDAPEWVKEELEDRGIDPVK